MVLDPMIKALFASQLNGFFPMLKPVLVERPPLRNDANNFAASHKNRTGLLAIPFKDTIR